MPKQSMHASKIVSIVIPAVNEQVFIEKCLQSLNSLKYPDVTLEIIVVDNGSTDNTVQVAKALGSRVLIKMEGTIASLRNHGAQHSTGTYLAFLDADCIPDCDWLDKSLPQLETNNRLVLGYRLAIPQNSNWVAKSWDMLFVKRYFTAEAEWIPTGNMIMHRDAFLSVAGFDESLESNEDYDFCFRLREQGYKIISSSETTVTHFRPPKTLKEIFKKEIWHGKEVFKVFFCDIMNRKGKTFYQIKNLNVVIYALFFLMCIALIIASILYAMLTKSFYPLLFVICMPILVAFLMALKRLYYAKNFNLIFGMTVLFLIYGFARAISPFTKYKFKQ